MQTKLKSLIEKSPSSSNEEVGEFLNVLLSSTNLLTAYEGLTIAKKAGIASQVFISAINVSSGESYITKSINQKVNADECSFLTQTVYKTYNNINEAANIARREASPLLFTGITQDLYAMAINQGFSDCYNEKISNFVENNVDSG